MPEKQDIIKHMLSTIGQSGVNTAHTMHPSVQNALAVLMGEDKEFQERGWWFNAERDITLVQNEDGEIVLPDETLKFYITNNSFYSPSRKNIFSRRNNKLYDTYRHTFAINESVTLSLVMRYEIDDLPPVAQTYLKHKAAETFFLNEDGDQSKYQRLVSKTALAWHNVVSEQLQMAGTNALDTPMAMNLQRGQNPGIASRNPNVIGGRSY